MASSTISVWPLATTVARRHLDGDDAAVHRRAQLAVAAGGGRGGRGVGPVGEAHGERIEVDDDVVAVDVERHVLVDAVGRRRRAAGVRCCRRRAGWASARDWNCASRAASPDSVMPTAATAARPRAASARRRWRARGTRACRGTRWSPCRRRTRDAPAGGSGNAGWWSGPARRSRASARTSRVRASSRVAPWAITLAIMGS